jgi:hypothetical protein
MGNQIFFKIAGYLDLAVLIIFTLDRFLILLTGFELLPKNLQFYHVLFLVTTAMLIGARHHRTFETKHPSDDPDQVWFQLI